MTPIRIGVFDSGVGGLSILRELRAQIPGVALHYIADSGHAPYGERPDTHVIDRSRALTTHLIAEGARIVVIACNTATAVASQVLRDSWPGTPIVGVEPGIKPALAASRSGRIGVMATRTTLGSEKFQRLMAGLAGGATIHLRACDGLAAAIERGRLDAPELLSLVERHCAPMRADGVDTVVLGCTHYAFVRDHIQAALGADVRVLDTATAVARHTANIVRAMHAEGGTVEDDSAALVRLQSTGDSSTLQRIASVWLGTRHLVSSMTDTAPFDR